MSHGLVPAGSTIKRVYYQVPDYYGFGTEFATFIEARDAALIRRLEQIEQIKEGYPPNWPDRDGIAERTANVHCVVDLRWEIVFPKGGTASGTDTVIDRTNVAHLAHMLSKEKAS